MNIGLSAGLSIGSLSAGMSIGSLSAGLSIGLGAGIEVGLVPVSKHFTIMQGCQKV